MGLIVDGYNLLHAAGWLPDSPGPRSFEQARRALVHFIAEAVQDELRAGVVVVFDAAEAPPGLPAEHVVRGVVVRFARGYESADALIEELIAHDSSPRRLTVVSSDHRIQRAARRRRARAIDSDLWFEGVWRRHGRQAKPARTTAKPQGRLSAAEVQAWLDEFGVDEEASASTGEGTGDDQFPPAYCDEEFER